MTTNTTASWGLVVGYGSIGRHHAGVLASRYEAMAVVDVSADAVDRAQQAHPEAAVATSLDGLVAPGPWSRCTAVIATWGPGHVDLFGDLVDRGVRRILIEKPLAASIADASAMAARAVKQDVALGVHLHMRYSGLVDALRGLAREHDLGEPQSFLVRGGARCLVTNGIHYIDLATALFGGDPQAVASTAHGEAINPRSPDLHFYAGTAVWTFAGQREAVITFSHTVSLYEHVEIYYRDAVLSLSPFYEVVLRSRDRAQVHANPSVTRSGAASETLFDGVLQGIVDLPLATGRILDELDNGGPQVLSPSAAVSGVGAVIGALSAGAEGRTVTLPIGLDSDLAGRDWPMS